MCVENNARLHWILLTSALDKYKIDSCQMVNLWTIVNRFMSVWFNIKQNTLMKFSNM